MAHLGLGVARLERIAFDPYKLGWLQVGDVLRVPLKHPLPNLVGSGWDWR